MENVCWLHRSQQNMSKGSISFAMHRPSSRLYLRVLNPLLPRCVLWVPSNHDERVQPAHDIFHHPIQIVLLHHNAIWSKNMGAMYQRCMLKCFRDLIGWTIEAYVDDIVVKSKWAYKVIADLEQTFMKFWANGIKLNPEKCVFGVPRGMLLGFIVSEHGVDANPEKTSTITRMGLI